MLMFLSQVIMYKHSSLPLFRVQSLAGAAAEPEHPQLAVGILFPEIAQNVFLGFSLRNMKQGWDLMEPAAGTRFWAMKEFISCCMEHGAINADAKCNLFEQNEGRKKKERRQLTNYRPVGYAVGKNLNFPIHHDKKSPNNRQKFNYSPT